MRFAYTLLTGAALMATADAQCPLGRLADRFDNRPRLLPTFRQTTISRASPAPFVPIPAVIPQPMVQARAVYVQPVAKPGPKYAAAPFGAVVGDLYRVTKREGYTGLWIEKHESMMQAASAKVGGRLMDRLLGEVKELEAKERTVGLSPEQLARLKALIELILKLLELFG